MSVFLVLAFGLNEANRLGGFLLRANRVRVSVAAFIVVVGIATAPFFQQSVVIYSATVPDANNPNAFASAAFTYTGSLGYAGDMWNEFGKSDSRSPLFGHPV